MRSRHRAQIALLVCLAAALAGGASAATVGGATADPAPALETAPLDAPAQSSVSVESVTVDQSTVAVGETVTVEARVVNTGDEPTSYDATLTVQGEAVETKSVGSVEPGFPVIVPFEYTFEEAGTYTVSVGGAETEIVVEESGDGTDDSSDSENDGNSGDNGGDDASGAGEFEVQTVSVDPSTPTVGETVVVEAEVANVGEETGDFDAELQIDGEVVDTTVVEEIGTNIPIPGRFEYTFEEPGTYTVAVSGVEANETVTVEAQSSGGGGGGPLGFLPMGLLRPLVLFIVLPLLLVYLALKALAIYLGY